MDAMVVDGTDKLVLHDLPWELIVAIAHIAGPQATLCIERTC
jgi:hypothetical protein